MYRPEYPNLARASMQAGFSKSATAGSLGVSKQTFDTWCKEHPEFLAAVKEGEMLRTLKLETDLLSAPDGPTVTSRIFALKNAAPQEWRDRQEIDHTTNGKDMPDTQAAAAILIGKLDAIARRTSGEPSEG